MLLVVEECSPSKQQRIAVGRSGSSKNNHGEIEAEVAAVAAIATTTTIAVGLKPTKINRTTTTVYLMSRRMRNSKILRKPIESLP